jgi:hypothetical protein
MYPSAGRLLQRSRSPASPLSSTSDPLCSNSRTPSASRLHQSHVPLCLLACSTAPVQNPRVNSGSPKGVEAGEIWDTARGKSTIFDADIFSVFTAVGAPGINGAITGSSNARCGGDTGAAGSATEATGELAHQLVSTAQETKQPQPLMLNPKGLQAHVPPGQVQ